MELSFRDLKKRDVINVADGASLGRIIDIVLDFPKGVMVGIVVPGRRGRGLFGFFSKSDIFIDESRIVKIGNDVILVELKYGGGYYPDKDTRPPKPPRPPQPPCPPKNQSPCDNFNCGGFDIGDY